MGKVLLDIDKSQNKYKLVKKILQDKQKYIFGINVYTKELIDKVDNFKAIIDDFTNHTKYHELPIVRLDKIPKNSSIIVVSGGNILTAINRVKKSGFNNVIHYADILQYSNIGLIDFIFNENFKDIYKKNRDRFLQVYSILQDDISKKIFQKIVNFRYTYNIDHLNDFTNKEKEQYFENFLKLGNSETFVDIGSYDGFTTLEFMKRAKTYNKIFIFEPDYKNLIETKKNLKKYNNIKYIEAGAYDKKGIIRFNINQSASTIDANGNFEIKVDKIDNLINEKVTFIKMDIEGAEKKALIGARETISKYKPKMAISIYHSPEDFFEIPEIIFELVGKNTYDVYIRHYTESIYETIMFFIPKNTYYEK